MPQAPTNWIDAFIMFVHILIWGVLFQFTFIEGPRLYHRWRERWRLGQDDNAVATGRLRRWHDRWQRGKEEQHRLWLKNEALKKIVQRREWREAQRAALEEERARRARDTASQQERSSQHI